MNKKLIKLGIAGTAIFFCSLQVAYSGQHKFMTTVGYTSQPIGHHWYCQQYTSDCKIKSQNTSPSELTRKRWKELVKINAFSNNS
ncbi:MAG: transglutaminase-like cysteine peptidase, partial [Pseudomonadota bacterium]